jgi:hypothetical protein
LGRPSGPIDSTWPDVYTSFIELAEHLQEDLEHSEVSIEEHFR